MAIKTINERLVVAMARRKVKIVVLAKSINVSQSRVSHWRRGKPIKSQHIAPICETLKISSDWLLSAQGRMDKPVMQNNLSKAEQYLISQWRALTFAKETRKKFKGILRILLTFL